MACMSMNRPTLTVIIPVFNEASTVREVLHRVAESPVDKEILIVDDASYDQTREILSQLESLFAARGETRLRVFYQNKNQGKGAAIRRAQMEAAGEVTIIQDADLEVDPREYGMIIKPILDGQADVVYGSRFHSGPHWVPQFWSFLANKLLTLLSNIMSGIALSDMETCYKAFKTDLFKSIPLRSDRFGFEPEVTMKVAQRRFRIYEVPISYQGRSCAQGKKIGAKDALQAIGVIIKYWLIDDSMREP